MIGLLIRKRDRSADNSSNSPFLHKLPPEIRMRIYEYVLGGNTIFFDRHHSPCTNKCHRNRYRCRAHVAEEDTNEARRKSESKQVKESQYRADDDWERSGDVDLELLLTCRQVYNETVLVPFSANEFGLSSNYFTSDDRTKILFLRDLISDQSRAISTLHIRGTVSHGFVQQHIKSMFSLRNLKLSFDWNLMVIEDSPDLLMAALEERFDASGVSMFAMANLQTVEITINLTVCFRDVQAVMAQEDELVAWIESKRAHLLTRQSPVARTQRAVVLAGQQLRTSKRIKSQKKGKHPS